MLFSLVAVLGKGNILHTTLNSFTDDRDTKAVILLMLVVIIATERRLSQRTLGVPP